MISFPTKTLDDGEVIHVIKRGFGSNTTVEVELNDAIERMSMDFILHSLSYEVYKTHTSWDVIMNSNLPKHPAEYKAGDLVQVPVINRDTDYTSVKRKRSFSLEDASR